MFDRFFRYFKNKIEMTKVFKESNKYFQNGKYFIDNSLTYICINDKSIMNRASDMFKNDLGNLLYSNKSKYFKKTVMYIIRILLFSRLEVLGIKNDEKVFLGSVFSISGNGKDYKIFDFKNKKVLWKFSCEEDFISKANYYKIFRRYFSMPKQYDYNCQERMVFEEYIDFIPYNHWRDKDFSDVINHTFTKYISYFQDCKELKKYTYLTINCCFGNLSEQDRFLRYVKNNIHSNLINIKIPVLKMHGDLWTSNMLLSRKPAFNVFYIDWEHSKELVFFYDFFFVMWNDTYLRENYYYLNQFIRGEYDNFIDRIFSIFDMQYNKAFKIDYFSMFFIVMFEERWKSESYAIQEEVFNQYKKIVAMMRGIESEE